MLHSIINLYVCVLFFLCKGLIHKHKIKQKQVKSKALREEVQSASVDNEGQSYKLSNNSNNFIYNFNVVFYPNDPSFEILFL